MQRYVIMLVLLAAGFVACREQENPPAPLAERTRTNQRTFQVQGVVKKVDTEGKLVTIQHEAIPDYMAAMTMPFEVKDTNEVKDLQIGDTVSFRLLVTADDSWIDQIKKTGSTERNEVPSRPSVRMIRDVEPLKVGDLMPDYRFTNELGQAVSLSDFKGKALALTFIFTRCPLPEFCPLMARNFASAYQQLTAMPNGPTNWHLLAISFDPHFDTPAVLKGYAQRYQYDPQRWSFVTGALIDIDAITEQFDLPVYKQGENWDHKLRTVVIDATGRIQKILISNQWKVEELVSEIVKATEARP